MRPPLQACLNRICFSIDQQFSDTNSRNGSKRKKNVHESVQLLSLTTDVPFELNFGETGGHC